jgi:hypothetical protein
MSATDKGPVSDKELAQYLNEYEPMCTIWCLLTELQQRRAGSFPHEPGGDATRYQWLRQCTAGQWEELNDVRLALGAAAMDAAIDRLRSVPTKRGGE